MNRRSAVEVLGEAIAEARKGDRDAVHFLYIRYADLVYACVVPILRDPAAAEELTQGVFSGLADTIGGYEPSELPFPAWLERLARAAALELEPQRRVPSLSR
jgi:RNA polymerase sigma-70 factor (ECF subfamily)